MSIERPIARLPAETARKIAAGEVIERPASALRELLDNSVDSGAASISAELRNGGIDLIRVTDDGSGMTKEDLSLVATAHATSKIRSESDLLEVRSLGFRGEALASMEAVAILEIVTSTGEGPAWKLSSGPGRDRTVSPTHGKRGTAVEVASLFGSFPARRQFLKSPRSEASLCARVFDDKAEARPDIAFTLIQDGETKRHYPKGTLLERVLAVTRPGEPENWFFEAQGSGRGISLRVVAGNHEVIRRDRSAIAVFVNGRKIQEFALVQAIEYAYSGHLPGGQHPFVQAFVEIDPDLVDFNIHPAKKEARFKAIQDVRDALIATLRSRLSGVPSSSNVSPRSRDPAVTAPLDGAGFGFVPARAFRDAPTRTPPTESHDRDYGAILGSAEASREAYGALKAAARETWKDECVQDIGSGGGGERPTYLGRALGCFLLAASGNELWFVDQHAAHERIIYDRLAREGGTSEELLVPIVIETEGEDLERERETLERAGFRFEAAGKGSWSFTAVPASAREAESIVASLSAGMPSGREFERALWADIACKSAVKDGDELDDGAARALVEAAFALPERRCPHGRPVMFSITREDAFARVRRTIF